MACAASSRHMKPASSEVRRARPLLGTFVEITATGGDTAKLHRAIDNAFAAICAVHHLMNFHDLASDVSRLNAEAARRPVRVHRWTQRVLRAAKNFSRESSGAFDITVASLLRRWRFLPQTGMRNCVGGWADIVLGGSQSVRFRRPLIIDLGGIAKGFAVDRATEVLITAGVRNGIVNAGGDLRVFGSKPRLVHIRDPLDPARVGRTIVLRENSLATSALYYSKRPRENRSPLIDGRTRRPALNDVSVSVCASNCMTADALTKIALAMREEARSILNRHHAEAFLLHSEFPTCRFLNKDGTQRCQA